MRSWERQETAPAPARIMYAPMGVCSGAKLLVPLHLLNHLGRHALIVLQSWRGANHAMPDRLRSREVAGVQYIGHQLECDRAVGQGRGLVHQLLALGVLDPELALIGADPVHRAFIQLAALAAAGLIDAKI